MIFYLTAGCFLASLVLGGPTQHGFLSDALLQVILVPLLVLSGSRLIGVPRAPLDVRLSLAFCGAILALPLLQLLPLPPTIWSQLPHRSALSATYGLLGRPLDWRPLSMNSEGTWLSGLSLLPPIALFLAVLTLGWKERRALSLILVSFAMMSGFMALLQASQGEDSALRFYNKDLHDTAPVGFFVNRNHLGALLYSGAIFATAWILSSLNMVRTAVRLKVDRPTLILLIAAFALLVLGSVELFVRSRAGVLLYFAGFLAILLMSAIRFLGGRASSRFPSRWRVMARRDWLMIGAVATAVLIVATLFAGRSTLDAVLDRFSADPLADERPVFAKVTFRGAVDLMPFGAGLGSFVSAYQTFEKPKDIFGGVYANHAHNDLLELALETGLGGLTLLCAFLLWLAGRARNFLTDRNRPATIDAFLRDAALVVVILLLAHSLVDYPLRTNALMSVFAFSCALLFDPVRDERLPGFTSGRERD